MVSTARILAWLSAVKVPVSLSSGHEGSSRSGGRDPTVGYGLAVRQGGGGAAGAPGGHPVVDGVDGGGVEVIKFHGGRRRWVYAVWQGGATTESECWVGVAR